MLCHFGTFRACPPRTGTPQAEWSICMKAVQTMRSNISRARSQKTLLFVKLFENDELWFSKEPTSFASSHPFIAEKLSVGASLAIFAQIFSILLAAFADRGPLLSASIVSVSWATELAPMMMPSPSWRALLNLTHRYANADLEQPSEFATSCHSSSAS